MALLLEEKMTFEIKREGSSFDVETSTLRAVVRVHLSTFESVHVNVLPLERETSRQLEAVHCEKLTAVS